MKKILFVTGYCATGKSTFARRLGAHLGLPCYCKDTLKETLADSLGARQEGVTANLSGATFALLCSIAQTTMAAGQGLILEGNFRPGEAQQLAALVQRAGYQSLSFLFTGDLRVLYERYTRRDPHRHPVHRRMASLEEFSRGNKPLGDVEFGRTITTDATVLEQVNYEQLLGNACRFTGQAPAGPCKAGFTHL